MANESSREREIVEYVATLERSDLEQKPAITPELWRQAGNTQFWRIRSIASFWKDSGHLDFGTRHDDLLTSLHTLGLPIIYVIRENSGYVEVYWGIGRAGDTTLGSGLLKGAFPGIEVVTASNVINSLNQEHYFSHHAQLTGIPTRKFDGLESTDDSRISEQIERIIRGMRGDKWAYLIRATPELWSLQSERAQRLTDAQNLHELLRQQLQRTFNDSSTDTSWLTSGITESLGLELLNKHAEHAIELVNCELTRLNVAQKLGRWTVEAFLLAESPSTLVRLKALVKGAHAGKNSHPQPIRVVNSAFSATGTNQHVTRLNSTELSALVQMPRTESPGYQVRDFTEFDIDPLRNAGTALRLGKIIADENEIDGTEYSIHRDDLTRHAFVAGVTGSGKTLTIFGILSQLDRPFLVIEPAKREYRSLKNTISDLRVYTLAGEMVSPFRLNPFEFELDSDAVNHPVQTHIDFLKAVFNSAFILYAPMPYILDVALHELYEDCGWNLVTGTNSAIPERATASELRSYPIFPTLSELYDKVRTVTERLDYDGEMKGHVIAGLQARIGSLRIGNKGAMLDVPRGIPMADLLQYPTVLELDAIGTDDEKTFIIGLFFARLYEFRRLRQQTEERLNHLLVIEEAHRLLRNVDTHVGSEDSNLKAQAVETFSNMLSEIRAYGQGVLIADQVPTKLTPDVIKNTNLKIVHRLVASDDREAVGNAINLADRQFRFLSTLRRQQVVISAEGADRPYLVLVNNHAHLRAAIPDDSQVSRAMRAISDLSECNPVPDWRLSLPTSPFKSMPPQLVPHTSRILVIADHSRIWSRLVLTVLFARGRVHRVLSELRHLVSRECPGLSDADRDDIYRISLSIGINRAVKARRQKLQLSFAQAETVRKTLTQGLIQNNERLLNDFSSYMLKLLRRSQGPYPGCTRCPRPCELGFEVSTLLSGRVYAEISAVYESRPIDERVKAIEGGLRRQATKLIIGDPDSITRAAFCLGVHFAAHEVTQLDFDQQVQFGKTLADRMRP